jgi:hypothetical protein
MEDVEALCYNTYSSALHFIHSTVVAGDCSQKSFYPASRMFKLKLKSRFVSCMSWLFGQDVYRNCDVRTRQSKHNLRNLTYLRQISRSDNLVVEDYRPGYPRFSALVAAHTSFQICRRFSTLRARLLLLKQDKLSRLEQQLEKIDTDERAPLFLGSSRDDTNEERSSTLSEIDRALADYGM